MLNKVDKKKYDHERYLAQKGTSEYRERIAKLKQKYRTNSRAPDPEHKSRCSSCGEIKLRSEFYVDRHSPVEHKSHCKACCRRSAQQDWKASGRRTPINPVKARARELLRYAVKSGRVKKPKVCERCSRETVLHGHHADYSKPLDVRWLCSVCHGIEHRVLTGNQVPE